MLKVSPRFQSLDASSDVTVQRRSIPYRPDIDGLRALAVLCVMVFHIVPGLLPGGFAGVDIFFVISGFLITGVILTQQDADRFSLAAFYAARVRRIFPALAFVLVACLVAGWLIFFPQDYRLLGREVAAAAGFVSNVDFWLDSNYFGTAAELKPTLHIWSLGVEEQFYLFWPLVLCSVPGLRAAALAAAAILALSFAVNIVVSGHDLAAAFYLPFTRFWELMLGCLMAIGHRSNSSGLRAIKPGGREGAADVTAVAGLALVGAGLVLISPAVAFPGWWALLPCLGTVLVIAAGPGARINHYLLGNRALVYVGRISYPLYLWHWPLLVFFRHVKFQPANDTVKFIVFVLTWLLADLTWRFVETPIRRGASPSRTLLPLAAVAACGLAGLVTWGQNGFPARFPSDVDELLVDRRAEAIAAQRWGRCFRDVGDTVEFPAGCGFAGQATNGTRVLLWGDSHAASLYPGLEAVASGETPFQLAQFGNSGCPPAVGFASLERPHCSEVADAILERIKLLKPDLVLLDANWSLYDGQSRYGRLEMATVAETVNRLRALGVKRIVAIGEVPHWRIPPPHIRANAYRYTWLRSGDAVPVQRNLDLLDSNSRAVDVRMERWFTDLGVEYISAMDPFCNAQGCLVVVPDTGVPIAFDGSHLTVSGSLFLARAIVPALGLSR